MIDKKYRKNVQQHGQEAVEDQFVKDMLYKGNLKPAHRPKEIFGGLNRLKKHVIESAPSQIFLDFTDLTPKKINLIRKKFKIKKDTYNDVWHLLKALPEGWIKSYGKVGVILPEMNRFAEDPKPLRHILDNRYLTDEKFQEFMNKNHEPRTFAIRRKKAMENPTTILNRANALKEELIYKNSWLKNEEFYQKQHAQTERAYAIRNDTTEKIRSAPLMKKAAALIKPDGKDPLYEINYIKQKQALNSIVNMIKEAKIEKEPSEIIQDKIDREIRYTIIENDKSKDLTGRFARMTTTSAETPDEEHIHMENEIYTLQRTLELVGRWGCKHDYEEVVYNKETQIWVVV